MRTRAWRTGVPAQPVAVSEGVTLTPSLTLRVRPNQTARRPGYVLLAVLIVVVVLSLAAYQFTELMSSEYRAAARTHDAAQARLNAASGVHYAAAMLADPVVLAGDLGGDPFAAGAFAPMEVRPDPTNPRRNGWVALVAVANNGPGSYEQRYGAVVDEAGKLNINTLIQLDPSGQQLSTALLKLPNMTQEVADAIVDWVDPDDDARPGGAESAYYQGLPNPYRAKNGPLNSLDELLLVKGVGPQLLFGTDRNRNGVADDEGAGSLDRGWADFLTVYGRELNVDSAGVIRENLNESEDLPALHQRLTQRVGAELADFILAYKMFSVSTVPAAGSTSGSGSGGGSGGSGSNSRQTVQGTPDLLNQAVATALQTLPTNRRRIRSLLDLRTARVTLPRLPGTPQEQPDVVFNSPLSDPARLGELLPVLMDKTSASAALELTPRVNLNTAPREVLVAIPNLTEADADAIIASRSGRNPLDPATLTGAWVVTAGGMNPDTFKRIERYVTGQTMVYRIQAIGYPAEGGPVARVEAVIDTNRGAPRILYYRDLTDLDNPRGFEPPR